MRQCCGNCRYFDQSELKKNTYCRRYPPAFAATDGVDGTCYYYLSPEVEYSEWCGEWQATEEEIT